MNSDTMKLPIGEWTNIYVNESYQEICLKNHDMGNKNMNNWCRFTLKIIVIRMNMQIKAVHTMLSKQFS